MALLDDATDAAARTPALAVVPFLMTFAAFDKLARASAPGFHVGVKFTFPPGLGTLWSFVSLPGAGVTAHAPVPLAWTPVWLGVAAGWFLLTAAVTAGYLGGIANTLDRATLGGVDAAVEHAIPMLGVHVAMAAASVLAFLPAFVSPVFVVLAFPAALLVTYLLYGAPYLVVLDRSATDALAESYRLALDAREYRSFGLRYFAVAAVASVPLTALATNAGVLGVLAAAATAAYPSYVGSVATMRVVADAD